MAAIEFVDASKSYDGATNALDALTLTIDDGEFMVLVGPSGCGKTTALRLVAGLEQITSGEVRLGGRVINELDPSDRDVAMVFQNYALYPHMDVFGNLAFGLKMRGVPRSERRAKVEEIARVLGLSDYLHRRPGQLSGGQRQRVAMGRAIVREPLAFLMDEPLSNLDAKLRVQMRAEIARIQHQLRITTLYVTHDQIEAMTMGNRVAVMRKGKLQQVARPQDLYADPTNLFVASFIGSPAMNFVEGELQTGIDGVHARIGSTRFSVPPDGPLAGRGAGRVVIGFRPEHLSLAGAHGGEPRLQGQVVLVEALGATLLAHVECGARAVRSDDIAEGLVDSEGVDPIAGEGVAVLVAQLPADASVSVGERVSLAFQPDRAYYFDLATGSRIAAGGLSHGGKAAAPLSLTRVASVSRTSEERR